MDTVSSFFARTLNMFLYLKGTEHGKSEKLFKSGLEIMFSILLRSVLKKIGQIFRPMD